MLGARVVCLALTAALAQGCTTLAVRDADAPIALRFIGERTLGHRLDFGGTVVGGLSGIDRDPATGRYVVISDDRSAFSPARFYTARLDFDADAFRDAALETVVFLRRRDGGFFPPGDGPDGEAIRYDVRGDRVWWASEGSRAAGSPPFVRAAALDGRFVDEVPIAAPFREIAEGHGPRENRGFEGLSLSPGGDALWIAMEGPLLQDGPMPTRARGAWTRLVRHDRRPDGSFGPAVRQVVYPIDPLPDVFMLTARHALNSVAEILAYDDTRFLVLERAFVIGSGWHVRLYLADAATASDVSGVDALAGTAPFTPMTKRLVLDFDSLPVVVDNLEGLCFGPVLPNGHRTLVLVSDDNFNPGERTQFLAFEIVPRSVP